MKKKILSIVFLSALTIMMAGAAFAAIHNPSTARCFDKTGTRIDTKECALVSCECFFHQVEEYIKGFFR